MTASNTKTHLSNLSKGGNSEMLCYGDRCQKKFPKVVETISDKLALLHAYEFPMVFSIGWDVVIKCDKNGLPGKPYVLEGNLRNGGAQWSESANRAYKEKLITFLRKYPHHFYSE